MSGNPRRRSGQQKGTVCLWGCLHREPDFTSLLLWALLPGEVSPVDGYCESCHAGICFMAESPSSSTRPGSEWGPTERTEHLHKTVSLAFPPPFPVFISYPWGCSFFLYLINQRVQLSTALRAGSSWVRKTSCEQINQIIVSLPIKIKGN